MHSANMNTITMVIMGMKCTSFDLICAYARIDIQALFPLGVLRVLYTLTPIMRCNGAIKAMYLHMTGYPTFAQQALIGQR